MSSGKAQESINLFFFENGKACDPKKVTKKRCEVEKYLCKSSDGLTVEGKIVYSLDGILMCKIDGMSIDCDSGYVLVCPGEKFKCGDYEKAFNKAKCQPDCPPKCPPKCPAKCPPKKCPSSTDDEEDACKPKAKGGCGKKPKKGGCC